MCVTARPAEMGGTAAYTYATLDTGGHSRTRHVTGYQNTANNLSSGPNCMLLHFPGDEIRLTYGPEKTRFMMHDITRQLPALMPMFSMDRGTARSTARVAAYGDYYVVLAEELDDIPDALQEVPPAMRPEVDSGFRAQMEFYGANRPGYSFVLACFDGRVQPRHPIVVEYFPHNDDVLFIPGLDAHDGRVPVIGQLMKRDFRVAFGAEDSKQPIKITYKDPEIEATQPYWAPRDVTGFHDNGVNPNVDYFVPLVSVEDGFIGPELAELLF